MKISIITAVFNRAETIGEAIESIQKQNYGEIEHLIQDGGSTDGTLDAIRSMADARTRLESAPDGGIYDALNRGIARARGDVIGLMHSDDYFASPNTLGKIASAFAEGEVDGIYGDLDYVSARDPDRVIRQWRAGHYTPDKLVRGWMPPHPTLYLKCEVFKRFGFYDTTYRISGDYEAILRWLVKGRIRLAYIPEVLVKMRLGGASNRSLTWILKKSWEDYRAIRENEVGGLNTLILKNISKIRQFFPTEKRIP